MNPSLMKSVLIAALAVFALSSCEQLRVESIPTGEIMACDEDFTGWWRVEAESVDGDDDDALFGGSGNNVMNGDDGDDLLTGSVGVDTLNGNGDDDTLSGGDANDVLNGQNGDDTIAIRSMMYLALTYDHRLVDGADAGRFLSAVKERLQSGSFEGEL